jgi:acetyltransferase-like isoleucine patch superfamily enzyme
MSQKNYPGTAIGDGAVLRSGGIIYCDVKIGHDFQCGHNVLIRERTVVGNNVSVGTATVIEGNCRIGDDVNIQSMVFIPTHTGIGDRVFIGPSAVLTNDRYPPTGRPELKGPVVEDDAVIGANATILPGIRIGKGALVAAGAVVTKDVPDGKMAIGIPAIIRDLPEGMR